MTHFHLMRTQKHKILSIAVLNMAKYTIISLILTDFVPIFFIFNLFQRIFRGSFRLKKILSSKKFPRIFNWKASLRDNQVGFLPLNFACCLMIGQKFRGTNNVSKAIDNCVKFSGS